MTGFVTIIVEGPGDVAALPILFRRITEKNGIFSLQIASRPKSNVDIRKLLRPGEIERYVEYCRRDPNYDQVLIALDCEDACAQDVCSEFCERISAVYGHKRTAVVLFEKEFKTMFFHSLDLIVAAYPEMNWQSATLSRDIHHVRGAKEQLSKLMAKGKAYKETRDQAKFATVVDLDRTQECPVCSRLERAILWLCQTERCGASVFAPL